jgi:nucleoid-associated protein YgaU
MTDAPSRNGRVVGPSNGAVAPARERAAQARRRYPPERGGRGLSRLGLLVLVLVIAAWAGARIANGASNGPAYSEHTYVVRSGDTLWSVAGGAYAGSHDPRQLVYRIEQRNHLAGADIHPGELLVLPIVSE